MTLYYVQDTRQFVGNSKMWWRHNGEGYTTDLSQAGQYESKPSDRDTDVLWPVDYIDSIATLHVDNQNADLVKALKGEVSDKELIKRLRAFPSGTDNLHCHEAADKIESQAAKIERLTAQAAIDKDFIEQYQRQVKSLTAEVSDLKFRIAISCAKLKKLITAQADRAIEGEGK